MIFIGDVANPGLKIFDRNFGRLFHNQTVIANLEGPLVSNPDDYFKLKGRVLGDEKKKLFLQSDIFVLPTFFVGYPNSLIEAMATGIACVSTKVGSIPDIIKHKKTGLLIEKKNINQLADYLEILITDSKLRKDLALNTKEQVNKNNSVDVGIKKFKILFGI